MAKIVSVADWTKFCKENPAAKDDDLADALKDYARTQDGEPAGQIKSLKAICAAADAARIKHAKNKEIAGYLQDVVKNARVLQVEAEDLAAEEPEPDGVLNDERDYKKYLKQVMNKLKKGPLNFALGLGRKPDEHRIIFHKSKAGKALLAVIKNQTDLDKLTFGLAGAHEEAETTLTLALEGKQFGGLKKKGEQFLKYFKPLPFDTILLMVDGEIVEDLPDPDEVVDASATEPVPGTTPPATPQEETIPQAPPTPPANLAVEFKQRLAALVAQIKQAAGTPVGDQAKLKASEAGAFARKDDYPRANSLLDEAEQLLSQTSGTVRPAPPLAGGNPADSFRARLAALVPQIKQAAGTPIGDQAKLKASEAGNFARKNEYPQALALLDEAELLFKTQSGAAPVTASATEPGVDPAAQRGQEFAQQCEALEELLLEAKKADPDKATKLAGVWDFANAQAENGNFDKAFQALQRLREAIETIRSAPAKTDADRLGIEAGIVEKRKFLVTRFQQIPLEFKPHLEAVKRKILDSNADANPDELIAETESALQALCDELRGEIDASINAGESSRIAGLKNRVVKHELVRHLLNNPFTDGSTFQAMILDALDEVEQKLAS